MRQDSAVSQTTTVRYRDRHFWALDDAFAVWLAYLVEELEAGEVRSDELAAAAEHWRVATFVTDFGADIPDAPEPVMARLRASASRARDHAVTNGDVSTTTLAAWKLIDDQPVSGGFSRTGDHVEVTRILEVADAFIALLSGSLPPDPAHGAWFVGTGNGFRVISESS